MVKKILQSQVLFYSVLIIIAVLVFGGTYGFQLINPKYLEVCYIRGDLTQHYFGWVGFRNSDWQIPLGLYDNNTYPDSTSIIFTDSIPILAIFFKIFRSILPSEFQYFGIFTLGCYIAQIIIAARIIDRICKNKIYATISSVVFLFMPLILHRSFGHEALTAQFLILFMIETLLMSKDVKPIYIYIRVGICALLSAGIHIYFVLICGIILLGLCINYAVCRSMEGFRYITNRLFADFGIYSLDRRWFFVGH